VQNIKLVFLSLSLLISFPLHVLSQQKEPRGSEIKIIAPDTLLNPRALPTDLPDLTDSIMGLDTIPISDTTKVVPKNEIETTISYFAEDSIVSDFTANKVFLYKDAWFEYGNIRLDANYIEIDWENSEIYASGLADTTGVKQGNPIFKEGASTYEIRKEMRYNFKSRKAIITDVVTQQDEGLLRGETVKKAEDGSVYLSQAFYTTCDLVEPHWHISSNKIKSIRGEKIVTGPFNFYFNNIPTPLGLPFGLLPDQPEEQNSGIIFPSYGEEQARGFFLRDFGYYFALNDYIHAKVTGEVFSKGGYGVKTATVYNKRYRFRGGFNVDYQRFNSPETAEVPINYDAFWLRWNHTPESRGNSRFSASANFGTKSYNDNILDQNRFTQNTSADFSSNVSYSKTFTGTPFSMSANLRHSQNQLTDEVNLLLPEVAINMNRQNPFRNLDFQPLKTLNIAYNFNAQNSINNRVTQELGVEPELIQQDGSERASQPQVTPFTFDNLPKLLRDAENGFKHNIPISSNFSLFRFFTGNASFNYTELWYLNRINYYYNVQEERVDRILENGFNRLGFYNTSFSLTTNIYGFYTFKKGSKIEAIRHHILPNLSFSSTPDFSDPKYGFYQTLQSDASGRERVYSRYEGFIFGGAPRGESKSVNFSIRNVLEAKVRSESDTAEATTKKVPILQSLNITSSYNFAVDSFNLAPFAINTRTSLFDKRISANLTASLDPYAVRTTTNAEGVSTVRRINEFAWKRNQGIGSIRRATLNLNGSINPSATEKSPSEVRDELTNEFLEDGGQMNEFVENEIDRIAQDPSQYIDWSIPWNLTFGYTLNYNNPAERSSSIQQSVNMSGDLSLSDKWKINFTSNLDISTGEITSTMIGIARDLHCWQMNVNWVPFGRFTSYSIDIRVKSSILKDLKVSRRRSFFDSF
jgi:hypothetical protein